MTNLLRLFSGILKTIVLEVDIQSFDICDLRAQQPLVVLRTVTDSADEVLETSTTLAMIQNLLDKPFSFAVLSND